jgi:hypothetical protein
LESPSRDGRLPVQQTMAEDQGAAIPIPTAGAVAVAEGNADALGRSTDADADADHMQRL